MLVAIKLTINTVTNDNHFARCISESRFTEECVAFSLCFCKFTINNEKNRRSSFFLKNETRK